MYEALLRERMDAEQSDDLDAQLDDLSDDVPEFDEKAEILASWGGEAVLC